MQFCMTCFDGQRVHVCDLVAGDEDGGSEQRWEPNLTVVTLELELMLSVRGPTFESLGSIMGRDCVASVYASLSGQLLQSWGCNCKLQKEATVRPWHLSVFYFFWFFILSFWQQKWKMLSLSTPACTVSTIIGSLFQDFHVKNPSWKWDKKIQYCTFSRWKHTTIHLQLYFCLSHTSYVESYKLWIVSFHLGFGAERWKVDVPEAHLAPKYNCQCTIPWNPHHYKLDLLAWFLSY